MMEIAHWEVVKNLVHDALALAGESRERFLEERCGTDDGLRAEVESLLRCDARNDASFAELQRLVVPEVSERPATGYLAAGQVFADRYLLLRRLGEGGMGQVWLAEQTQPVRRQVALKLIRAGMYDESVSLRFQSECQSLAIMDHPAIAKVFDAGTTPLGHPFFVMEYVPGQSITEYCDARKLGIRARIELFLRVCEGVQHAHQKAIIHRDLKPANILVDEIDGSPKPRIIDFGLAKLALPAPPDEAGLTRYGNFLGTPGYMSPEQADPSVRDIDTRTDVYSLGVILCVLLVGLEPFETFDGRRAPLDEWLRRLREEDPPRPSAKLAGDRSAAAVSAAARCIELNELIGLLRHDLDWIVMKAEERDRERRYGSPSDLAADLRRYLRNEPVTARPPSTLYQLGKFIRRRRIAAAFSAAIALLAILASGAGIIAVRQRNIALMEQGSADRTARFMVSLFQLADPDVNRGNSVTVREVLDRGAAQVDHNLADEPAIRADLLTAMGQAYAGLGLYDPAKKLLGDARADQTHAAVPAESRVRTLAASGRTLYLAADYADAEPLLRQAVDLGRRELPADDPLRAEALDALAEELVQLRRYAEAEKLCDEALADDRRRGPAGAASTARTLDTLGVAYFFGNDLPAAESTWRQALDLHQHVSGDRDAATAQAMNNLGAVLYQSGRIRDAVDMYRESLRVLHAVYGENHPEVAVLLHNLGNATLMLGQIDEAEPLLRQALAMTEKFKGGNHDDLVPPLNMLAMIDEYAGRTAEAQAEIRRAEQIARLPNHGVLLDEVLLNLADLALESGHADQAAAALAESRRLLEAAYPLTRNPGEAWRYALWDTVNAKFLAQRGDSKSAKRIVDAALPVIERRFERNGFNSLLARRRAQAVARAVPQV